MVVYNRKAVYIYLYSHTQPSDYLTLVYLCPGLDFAHRHHWKITSMVNAAGRPPPFIWVAWGSGIVFPSQLIFKLFEFFPASVGFSQ